MSFGRCRAFPLAVFVALVTVLSTACGGDPPDREMQQAQAAIDMARAVGAERYAKQELTAAEEALKNARAAVDQHDYRLALNHSLDSRERAQNATKQTGDGKAAERQSADGALSASTTALRTVQGLLKTAESARVPARVLASARSAVAAAEPRLQEARAAHERGEYPAASATAAIVTEQLQPVIAELTAATTPTPHRRR